MKPYKEPYKEMLKQAIHFVRRPAVGLLVHVSSFRFDLGISAIRHEQLETRNMPRLNEIRFTNDASRPLWLTERPHVSQHLPGFFFRQDEWNKRSHRRSLAAILQNPE